VIVDAIASRDAARAAELVSDHLMRTLAWHSKLSVLRDKICFDREGLRRPAHPRASRTAYWRTMLSASSSKSNWWPPSHPWGGLHSQPFMPSYLTAIMP
jgi:hypothetical protein